MSNTEEKAQEPPFDVFLDYPIRTVITGKGESEITVVKVKRRARLKDLKVIAQAGANKIEQTSIAIERLTDLPKGALDELDVKDFEKLAKALSPFFETDEEEDSAS